MKISTRDITRIGIFAAVTAVLSQIAIPLPFTPVQLSLGLVAVFATGILLSPMQALFAQMAYLLLGAFGLPVFQGFMGGAARLFGPTGGYLAAYPLMAFVIAVFLSAYEKYAGTSHGVGYTFWAGVGITVSLVICYSLGTAWLSYVTKTGIREALAMAVYPFVPLDMAKIVFSCVCLIPLKERFRTVLNV